MEERPARCRSFAMREHFKLFNIYFVVDEAFCQESFLGYLVNQEKDEFSGSDPLRFTLLLLYTFNLHYPLFFCKIMYK